MIREVEEKSEILVIFNNYKNILDKLSNSSDIGS